MIQKDRFKSTRIFEKGVHSGGSQSVEGFVGGSENSEFFARSFQRRRQTSGFDCGRKSGEALVTQDGAHQILRWNQNLINDVNNSIAGQDIELRHVSFDIDDNPAAVDHTDTKVVSIHGLDNVISKVALEDLAADDVVQENIRKSVRIFKKSLDIGIPEFGESLVETMPTQR